MTLIFKLILLASYVGLVVIVAKNRMANPEMRLQFFEDLEKNKKRIRHAGSFLLNSGGVIAKKALAGSKYILPYLKAFLFALGRTLKTIFGNVKHKIASQAKELKEDMKALEVPHHKVDFLEKLETTTLQEKKEHQEHKETKLSTPNFFSKRFSLPSFRESRSPQIKEPTPLRAQETAPLHSAQGFQEERIPARESAQAQEVEVDKDILAKKEKWLLYAIAKNPKNANFYKKLGRIYLQMSNPDDARNCFEYALKLGSQDPEVRMLLAQLRKT